MKSAEYWAKRSEQIAARQFKNADDYDREQRREYERATLSIKRDIEAFYARFAKNNEIEMAEARKLLTTGELKEFKMTLKEFTSKAKSNADGQWTKELNNVYFRTRISRLEALQVQINQQVEMLAGKRQAGTGALLGGIYKDTYYRTLYELQKGTGIGVSFARIDDDGLKTLLGAKLDGRNWSQRIWDDRTKLRQELQTKLSQSFIRGDSVDRTVKDVTERMNVSRSNAERLVQTESAFFTGQATMAGYKESGVVQKYEVLATLDSRTTPICREMDAKVFPLSEMQVGVNYPPFHVRCRTTTTAYFDDEVDVGERIARDADGKTYYVPGDTTYPEWEKKYVLSSEPPKGDKIKPPEYLTFSNPDAVRSWVSEVSPEWRKSLTDVETDAIRTYTGSSYTKINRKLRSGSPDISYDDVIAGIVSGLNKFELTDNITVYRGMNKNIFGVPASEMPGMVFSDLGFVSTSLLKSSSFGGQLRFEIRVPAGSKGAPVMPLSQFENENEFLLQEGTSFQIIDAKDENGAIFIIAEVIPNV
ncbi:ADP-ribosyltransferase [Paenibacillus hemerocallicola]|uniref:ADP-ribosyltransferase n=1 Tax=Paenibacillus hemerocallicola TaxID=1172614 RepID=UPI00159EBD52|nr:ADP-ribosyltransferase [Paenibacillus hemerocallicola]